MWLYANLVYSYDENLIYFLVLYSWDNKKIRDFSFKPRSHEWRGDWIVIKLNNKIKIWYKIYKFMIWIKEKISNNI